MSSTLPIKLLVINPNITKTITGNFQEPIDRLGLRNTEITYWTNPGGTGPATLSNNAEIEESAKQCLKPLLEVVHQYDGFYIAAYTLHPLVRLLRAEVGQKPVIGMFQASVATALSILPPKSKFAIVTTGEGFVEHLDNAVAEMLGVAADRSTVFAGTTASGVNWDILNEHGKEVAEQMIVNAVAKAGENHDVQVVCLGGAILHGFSSCVRKGCQMALGEERGNQVEIIDPLLPGIVTLDGLVRMYRSLEKTTALRRSE